MKESIQLPHGYTAAVELDQYPSNPFEINDCEPPMAVFNDGSLTGPTGETDPLTLADLFDRFPESDFETPARRGAIIQAAGIDKADWDFHDYEGEPDAEAWRWAIREELPEAPTGWNSAGEYFDRMEALCGLLGITCYNRISNGYSQSHSVRLFVAATPEWIELTGTPPEHHAGQCKAAADLYGAWAWGDVYGVSEITRPDGSEVPDAEAWGFYGSDHEASGLLEHCREAVAADRAYLEREAAASHEAACRDIATV